MPTRDLSNSELAQGHATSMAVTHVTGDGQLKLRFTGHLGKLFSGNTCCHDICYTVDTKAIKQS